MIEIVSAIRLAEREFFDTSPLGLSLLRLDDRRLTRTSVAFENRTGLSEIFNARIFSPDSAEILVFIHDDVWILDDLFCDRVTEGLVNYDVIGVAGNRRRVPGQPM